MSILIEYPKKLPANCFKNGTFYAEILPEYNDYPAAYREKGRGGAGIFISLLISFVASIDSFAFSKIVT